VTHKEKQQVITNLVNIPDKGRRVFWGREIKNLNILLEIYPGKKFWTNLSFYDKLDSIILLRSGYYAKELEKKYKRFHYKIPSFDKPKLGEVSGDSININKKPKTLKDFLS
jgi:hypothetical protein